MLNVVLSKIILETMNLSFINLQLLLSVCNALRSICDARAPGRDGKVVFTPQDLYEAIDRDTMDDWKRYCKGSDDEARVKFMPKELAEYGVIEQLAPGVYAVDPQELEEFECFLLQELCSRYLVIESGLCSDGYICVEEFKAYWENTDDPFFLSLSDLEEACTLYAVMYDIEDLLY